MQYYVRRVNLGSVGRLGCLLGWLVALPPALLLAWLVVLAAQQVHQALVQVKPITVSLLGQDLLRLDFLQILQLEALAQVAAALARDPVPAFLSLVMLSIVIGGLLWMLTALFVGLAYNVVARAGWGLGLELEPRNKPKTSE